MNRFGFSAILAAVFLSGCILTIDASESKQGILTSNILVQESKTVLKLKNEIAQPEAATNCSEDNPCHNWGTCLEGGTCACRNGTSGTQCQIVDDCEELPPMCGKGTDVKCVGVNMVDEGLVSGKCRCQDSAKKFDHGLELCRANRKVKKISLCCVLNLLSPLEQRRCVKYDDCDPNATAQVDSPSSAGCKEGVSGDRCEFIDQCRDRVVECGDAAPCTAAIWLGFSYSIQRCRRVRTTTKCAGVSSLILTERINYCFTESEIISHWPHGPAPLPAPVKEAPVTASRAA
ncbi:uncharacterized protein CEXT_23371 [Caerostris extrusa]|uniref:EGF-like domain-containing protein n=1 Tax=Caerostris extrusa TaxID=172846 RepID=A0AAV4S4I5_CAEEX|nr:uncharacterized protein CEXT_23371 [Caerostris extrusa]